MINNTSVIKKYEEEFNEPILDKKN